MASHIVTVRTRILTRLDIVVFLFFDTDFTCNNLLIPLLKQLFLLLLHQCQCGIEYDGAQENKFSGEVIRQFLREFRIYVVVVVTNRRRMKRIRQEAVAPPAR